ncbi:MAG TPA: extracellular solute-binding protein [Candidatus Binatia bacterium]|nr:extracellular solute-binding protein [Candidatus Binatia bacterium]
MRFKRLILAIVLTSLPVANIFAAAPQKPDLLANAKKEKTVNLYTSMEARESRQIADVFQQRYPFLTVDITRISNNRLLQRIMTEHRAGRGIFDVIITSGLEVRYLIKSGLVGPYISSEAKAFFADSKDPQGLWVDVYSSLRVFAYNSKIVSHEDAPRQYEDLLAPKWKSMIGLPSKEYGWFATVMRALGREGGRKFMEGLGRQQPHYRPSHVLILQFVAAGEFNTGLVYQHQLERYKKLAAPVELAPVPFAIKNIHPIAVAAAAPHASAARLFVNFVLSKDTQTLIRGFGRTVSRTDIAQDEIGKFKVVVEEIELADRMNEITADYDKYLQ